MVICEEPSLVLHYLTLSFLSNAPFYIYIEYNANLAPNPLMLLVFQTQRQAAATVIIPVQ